MPGCVRWIIQAQYNIHLIATYGGVGNKIEIILQKKL